jgi:hypothetical protein
VEEHAIKFQMPTVFFYSNLASGERSQQQTYTRILIARAKLPKQAFIAGNIRVAQIPIMA